ncbi:hypothetical protein, partial [Brevibacillus agri]|uniref:hypothetical protein n=1 Tax=Brevibacillus agri TaxID=51101 RepID=UPI0028682742
HSKTQHTGGAFFFQSSNFFITGMAPGMSGSSLLANQKMDPFFCSFSNLQTVASASFPHLILHNIVEIALFITTLWPLAGMSFFLILPPNSLASPATLQVFLVC